MGVALKVREKRARTKARFKRQRKHGKGPSWTDSTGGSTRQCILGEASSRYQMERGSDGARNQRRSLWY